MKAYNATTVATTIISAGNYPFLHIYNNSDTTVYLAYDGSSAALTTANGMPLAAGAFIRMDNYRNGPFKQDVKVIHGGTGNKELRIQGVD